MLISYKRGNDLVKVYWDPILPMPVEDGWGER